MRSRIGAYKSWATTEDRPARTAPARRASLERFEREVDPDGILTPQERAIRAEYARKAYMLTLALKSAVSRRRARESTAAAEAAEAELQENGEGVA